MMWDFFVCLSEPVVHGKRAAVVGTDTGPKWH